MRNYKDKTHFNEITKDKEVQKKEKKNQKGNTVM